LKNALAEIVLCDIDGDTEVGKQLGKQYQIPGYPTYILIDAQKEVIDMWAGYNDPEEWIATLDEARSDMSTIAEKKARFAKTPSVALGKALVRTSRTRSEYADAVTYLETMQRIDPDRETDYALQIFQSMAYGMMSESFTADQVIGQGRQVVDDPASTAEQKLDVAMIARSGLARGLLEVDQYVPFLTVAVTASDGADDESLADSRQELMVDHALYVDRDADTAVARKKALLDEDWQKDVRQLNRFAWWCFENKVNLQEAYELALLGVELADDDEARANVLDTAAELCYELGDCQQAVELIRRAVDAHPDREYYRKQLERFEGLLAEKG